MRFKRKKILGMSLIEVIVVTGLIAILALSVSVMMTRSLQLFRTGRETINEQEKTARVMREFEYSVRAATQILVAHSDELSFYRYYDKNATSPTKVRYFIEGTTFKVGKTLPVGIEPNITYPEDDEIIDFLVEDLTASSIFTYFNAENSELDQPVMIPDVKLIKLVISLDRNGSNPPAPIEESTVVNLRNKKTNL